MLQIHHTPIPSASAPPSLSSSPEPPPVIGPPSLAPSALDSQFVQTRILQHPIAERCHSAPAASFEDGGASPQTTLGAASSCPKLAKVPEFDEHQMDETDRADRDSIAGAETDEAETGEGEGVAHSETGEAESAERVSVTHSERHEAPLCRMPPLLYRMPPPSTAFDLAFPHQNLVVSNRESEWKACCRDEVPEAFGFPLWPYLRPGETRIMTDLTKSLFHQIEATSGIGRSSLPQFEGVTFRIEPWAGRGSVAEADLAPVIWGRIKAVFEYAHTVQPDAGTRPYRVTRLPQANDDQVNEAIEELYKRVVFSWCKGKCCPHCREWALTRSIAARLPTKFPSSVWNADTTEE